MKFTDNNCTHIKTAGEKSSLVGIRIATFPKGTGKVRSRRIHKHHSLFYVMS